MTLTHTKRKCQDGAYNPKHDRRRKRKVDADCTSYQNIFAMLAKHDQVSETGNPLKFSLLVNADKLKTNLDLKKVQGSFINKTRFLASFQPIQSIVSFSPKGSPLTVKIADGTILSRVISFGVLQFFSNQYDFPLTKPEIIHELKADTSFYQSPFYAAIQPMVGKKKKQKMSLTKEKLRCTAKANATHAGRSQAKVMIKPGIDIKKGSATQYAQATAQFPISLRFQWGHLKAHCAEGETTQAINNLVAITDHANHAMLLAELEYVFLAKSYSTAIKIKISSQLIPNTHIGTLVKDKIKTPDFQLPFKFNGQSQHRSHQIYQPCTHHFVTALVETAQDSAIPAQNKLISQDELKSLLFFRKRSSSNLNQVDNIFAPAVGLLS